MTTLSPDRAGIPALSSRRAAVAGRSWFFDQSLSSSVPVTAMFELSVLSFVVSVLNRRFVCGGLWGWGESRMAAFDEETLAKLDKKLIAAGYTDGEWRSIMFR